MQITKTHYCQGLVILWKGIFSVESKLLDACHRACTVSTTHRDILEGKVVTWNLCQRDEIRIQCKFLHTFDPLEACSVPFYTADFQNCRVREKSGSCLCASYSPQLKKSICMKGITDQDKTYQVIPLYEDSKYTVMCTYTHTEACAWTHTHIYHGATWRRGEDYKVWQSYFVL